MPVSTKPSYLKIPLRGGRSLLAGYSLAPKGPSKDWVVFLPESGSGFLAGGRREINQLLGVRLASRFNYLVVNKPGLAPSAVDAMAFERSFRRRRRVDDALVTLQAMIPANGRIYLIGYSEGAYLAPEIAARDGRIASVVMIGGGTRGWLKEELSHARSRAEKVALARQIRLIRKQSRSMQKWNGFSFATWNSYREDSTLKALRQLNLPVLSILGARDNVIDLKATLSDLRQLATVAPVQTEVLPSCGHSFSGHWNHVQRVVSSFLAD